MIEPITINGSSGGGQMMRNAAIVAEAITSARFTLEEGSPSRVKCEPGPR